MKKLVNYDLVDVSDAEIAEMKLFSDEEEAKTKVRIAEEEQKVADKVSGNQKLKDLGLTDDEITALVV